MLSSVLHTLVWTFIFYRVEIYGHPCNAIPAMANPLIISPFQEVKILSSRCGRGRLCRASCKIFWIWPILEANSASDSRPKSLRICFGSVSMIVRTFWPLSSPWGSPLGSTLPDCSTLKYALQRSNRLYSLSSFPKKSNNIFLLW